MCEYDISYCFNCHIVRCVKCDFDEKVYQEKIFSLEHYVDDYMLDILNLNKFVVSRIKNNSDENKNDKSSFHVGQELTVDEIYAKIKSLYGDKKIIIVLKEANSYRGYVKKWDIIVKLAE
jgi:hypothetical protein